MSSGAARGRRRSTGGGRVVVHIDRLVVDGLSLAPGQRLGVREAVESEMARLVSTSGLDGLKSSSLAKVATSPMSLPGSPSGPQVGTRVAGALHGFLGGGE